LVITAPRPVAASTPRTTFAVTMPATVHRPRWRPPATVTRRVMNVSGPGASAIRIANTRNVR
jgi:hypothetical protein